MRVLAFVLGLTSLVGAASAGDLNSLGYSDAAAGRLLFEARFGEHSALSQRSFQLQFGSDRQFNSGLVPFRAEYRQDMDKVLVNGMDISPMVFSHQRQESIESAWGGWVPLAIILSGIGFIVVDGHRKGSSVILPGGSGSGGY